MFGIQPEPQTEHHIPQLLLVSQLVTMAIL
jgi:hypothetical protein